MRHLALVSLCAVLSACGGGGGGSSSTPPPVGTPNPPPPALDAGVIVVTRSGSDVVATTLNGGSQTVLVTFSAQDERTVDTLVVAQGLEALPAGWSGPATFSCSNITQNNACSLSLTYAPTAVGDGTLSLAYTYDSAGVEPVDGEIEIPFEATANNNVVTTVTPTGQILGVLGDGHQSVRITFTSDDGNAARALVLTTNLGALPVGWSSTSQTFACAEISTGSGCQLVLEYAPPAHGDGTLSLAYDYLSNAGEAKSGTIGLSYVARVHNTVVATSSQALPFNVPIGASEPLTVTFTTDDGHPVRWVEVLTDLDNDLPAGWSAPNGHARCENVSSGNGCQLVLEYAPTGLTNGSFSLQFNWEDGAGQVDSAALTIGYGALTHNSVVGNADPSGEVAAIVGGTRPVRVTFTTDDSQIARDFALDADLSALPAGWSSAASALLCQLVHSAGTCFIDLSFQPTAAVSGTLALNYSYTNNAGTPRNGTVNVPYAATTGSNVVVSANPMAPYIRRTADNLEFTLTFTSDDGATITGFTTTTPLGALPDVHSHGQASHACATVSTGSGCTLTLTYQPGATRSGTISIGYSYTNSDGFAKTGTVDLPYESWPPLIYISSSTEGLIYRCEFDSSTGALSSCSSSGAEIAGVAELAFDRLYADDWVYVASYENDEILRCTRYPNGAITDCTVEATIAAPYSIVDYAGSLLVASTGVLRCPIEADGSLGACAATTGLPDYVTAMEVVPGGVLVSDSENDRLLFCGVVGPENAFMCLEQLTALSQPYGIAEAGGTVYVVEHGSSSVRACNWNLGDEDPLEMTGCESNNIGFTDLREVQAVDSKLLITTGGKVAVCDRNGTALTNCVESDALDVGVAISITRN